ncbi:MAG: hypothetical protein ABI175_09755 [Polyangiales bacterium]
MTATSDATLVATFTAGLELGERLERIGPRLELQDAEPLEARALPGREEIHLLQRGDDLGEEHLAEHLLALALQTDAHALFDREPHLRVDLLEAESIAHQHRGLVDEVLALHALRLLHVAVVVLEREHAVGHVPRLVAHHVVGELLEQRLLGGLLDDAERREREPLDHDLHAEQLHVPAAVLQRHVEEALEVRAHLVAEAELLVEIAVVDLDMARLVEDL